MSAYVRKKTTGDTTWFVHDRFGMFIHFGLYALPARHEWIKLRERISEASYQRYFDHFDPDLMDAREWAKMAKAAGMKYAVMTAKHHEGFCLFDSQYTDYKSTNTPCGRDLIKEYAEAFRAEGLRVGLYYSLLDWHHPHYPLDRHHPRTNDPDAAELDRGRDMKIYAEYMRNQVRELLTNYGKIDILWTDFSIPPMEDAPEWMQFG
ncbi:MAG: alpha-L-fucosidase, partial [Clostridia bacterium]|nr:alpha-L-fucosidase [Clostridia bacterium]